MKGKLIIIILIIILLMVYYLLGTGYMKQRKEQEALTPQIADVAQTLRQIPQPPQDLEQRLAVVQASLAAEQNAFPGKMNSTQLINNILKLADDCEVKAIPLVTQPWSTEEVGQHSYQIFRLNVAVEGSLPQLLIFIDELEHGEFETLVVEGLSVTRITEQPEEETTTEGTTPVTEQSEETTVEGTIPITASLDLAIYARSQTSD